MGGYDARRRQSISRLAIYYFSGLGRFPPQNLAAPFFVTKLASFAGEKKFSSPVPPGCLDFGGMVEGQILKAVDSAIEGGGGGGGGGLIVGMSPLLLPSSLPPQWLPAVLWKAKQSRAVQILND
jgi:hypothetical protein